MLLYLGSSPDVTKEHFEHLRLTVSGAAAIGASDIERCLAKSPKTTIFKQGEKMSLAFVIIHLNIFSN